MTFGGKALRLAALAACTALFGAVLTGCGDNKATSDEIRIGANFEMTGNTANYGTSTLDGLKLAIKEANEAGGVGGKKIVLIEADNKSDAAESANAADFIAKLPHGYDEDLGPQGGRLSGGQKQRIAIVRALCLNPEVILLDEITAALDPEMVREVLDVVLELAKEGMSMLIVTHEMAFARKVADRIVFMDKGEIVEEADPETFFRLPKSG